MERRNDTTKTQTTATGPMLGVLFVIYKTKALHRVKFISRRYIKFRTLISETHRPQEKTIDSDKTEGSLFHFPRGKPGWTQNRKPRNPQLVLSPCQRTTPFLLKMTGCGKNTLPFNKKRKGHNCMVPGASTTYVTQYRGK